MEPFPRTNNNDLLALVQVLGEVVKPIREDVAKLSEKVDHLSADISQRYYTKEVIDAMVSQREEQIKRLDQELGETRRYYSERANANADGIKAILDRLDHQWDVWLFRIGVVASLGLSLYANLHH